MGSAQLHDYCQISINIASVHSDAKGFFACLFVLVFFIDKTPNCKLNSRDRNTTRKTWKTLNRKTLFQKNWTRLLPFYQLHCLYSVMSRVRGMCKHRPWLQLIVQNFFYCNRNNSCYKITMLIVFLSKQDALACLEIMYTIKWQKNIFLLIYGNTTFLTIT